MEYFTEVDGEWVETDIDSLVDGEKYKSINANGTICITVWSTYNPLVAELAWVKGEIARFDLPLSTPDYPHADKAIAYRAALRSYNGIGDRPDTPTTTSGNPL